MRQTRQLAGTPALQQLPRSTQTRCCGVCARLAAALSLTAAWGALSAVSHTAVALVLPGNTSVKEIASPEDVLRTGLSWDTAARLH